MESPDGGQQPGVLRISVNTSNPESEAEDSFSVSSFSSTTSSINPPRESNLYRKLAAKNGAKMTMTSPSKTYFHANPAEVLSCNGEETPTSDLSRSVSYSNLSRLNDTGSPSTAREIRSITNNYQKLLNKATKEIRKLTGEKLNLETEMEKLLEANVELATESKKLLESQRDWRAERTGLMTANQEFVEEVERLYAAEERWEDEKQNLIQSHQQAATEAQSALSKAEEEKSKLEHNVDQLVETVKLLTFDNDKLIKEREEEQNEASKSSHQLKEEYEERLVALQATVSNLQAQVSSEGDEREKLELELESLAGELEKRIADQTDREGKMQQLSRRSEDMSAKLFEAQMAKDELAQQMEEVKKKEKKLKIEYDQMKVENQWLVSRGKEKDKGASEPELEKMRNELKLEKEKVTNLTTWKGQLALKNKELQLENERLLSRADDLEALMNEEVTDINELLSVINNIQTNTGVTIDTSLIKRRSFK